jgi:hypothetical protein
MAKTVSVDDLAKEITLAVKQYTEDVSKSIEKEVNETAKKVRKEAADNSPEDSGEYKKGWARKKSSKGGQIKYTIYNKEKPQITHLLEIGHQKVGGGRVDAIPHIRPAYDKFVPKMEKEIEQIIKRGGD